MGKLGIINKPKTAVTVDELKAQFPNKKGTITQETADLLNEANNDPMFNGDEFLSQMTSYSHIMNNNSYSMKEYITALKFCAYLESNGDNYTEAYKRARANEDFVKERAHVDTGTPEYKELTYAASRYRKSRIVKEILTIADMPLYLMFQGARYEAVAQLAKEMTSAAYSKDRISAADKLLTHVKAPENVQVELNVGMNQESKDIQRDLNDQLAVLANNQRKMLEQGYDIGQTQKLGISLDIIDGEVE